MRGSSGVCRLSSRTLVTVNLPMTTITLSGGSATLVFKVHLSAAVPSDDSDGTSPPLVSPVASPCSKTSSSLAVFPELSMSAS